MFDFIDWDLSFFRNDAEGKNSILSRSFEDGFDQGEETDFFSQEWEMLLKERLHSKADDEHVRIRRGTVEGLTSVEAISGMRDSNRAISPALKAKRRFRTTSN